MSLRAATILQPGVSGRVLASFKRVCDLVTDDGAVVALVWRGVGDGPLNVVLEEEPSVALPAGTRFFLRGDGDGSWLLEIGQATLWVDLAPAVRWDARPDWAALRQRRAQIAAGVIDLEDWLAARPARRSCAQPAELRRESPLEGVDALSLGAVIQKARAFVEAYCDRNTAALEAAISALCGLGPGLTPAGDDWLAGWLLGLWLGEGWGVRSVAHLVLTAAETRTTLLSRAFLACAAAGEMDANWHALLDALAGQPTTRMPIYQPALTILSHGATSGAAMLAGFLAALSPMSRWSEEKTGRPIRSVT